MFQTSTGTSRAQSASESTGANPRRWRASLGLLLLLLGCVLTINLRAQTGQGTINGRVTDTNGAVIQKASVQVVANDTQVAFTTLTNEDGLYNAGSLIPGMYTVTVDSHGFQKKQIAQVTVVAAQTTTIDVTLQPGTTSETVVVTAEDSLLSTDTSAVTTTVDHQIVQNLPYPERSALEAALMVPGVTGDPSVAGGIFSENPVITTGPVVPGASVTVGGAPPGTASIMVDGSDVTQASYARTGMNLSPQIVQEMTVQTTGVPANYGRTSGGVIIQTSVGGGSQYHGSAQWLHTDPYFNAVPYGTGTTVPSALQENRFGGYVGGPVWIPRLYNKNHKTFFFVGVEPLRGSNVTTNRGQFDTPADLLGQLHNSITLLNPTILKASGYAAAVAAPRVGGIYANSTVNAQGFPNGAIGSAPGNPEETGPSGLDDVSAELAANPFAQYIISLLPTPSNPGPFIKFDNAQGTYDMSSNNANYMRGVVDRDNRYSFRIDQQFNNNNKMFVRYSVVPISGPRYFALAISNPANQVPTDAIDAHNLALGYTWVISNSLVNNLHYSVMRVNEDRTPPVSSLTQDFAAKYGLTPATVGKGFPNLGTLGSSSLQLAADTPYQDVDQNFVGGDELDWTKGEHSFAFGVDLRWIQSNQYDPSLEYGGKYSFSAQMTNTTGTSGGVGGNALATLILGDIYSYQAAPVAVPGYYRWRYYAGYAQDDWRVMPKLTLNLGVRYEVETPRQEKFGNQALLLPSSLANPTQAAYCFSGNCGLGMGLWPTNYMGLEPRIGFAYAPTPKTSIRAAYGIFRNPLTGYENTPDPDLNVASTTIGNQTGGTSAGIVNYITNKVPALTSAYTALKGSRGPFYASQGLSPVYVDQTTAVPYMQSWNLTLQYEPTSHTLVQVSYHGVKGTHLIGAFTGAKNIPSLSTLTANVLAGVNLAGTAVGVTNGVNGVTGETVLQALNPFPGFATSPLLEIYPRRGSSSFNGFYANVNEQLYHGLSLLALYTWSKSLDNVPDTNAGNQGDFSAIPTQDPHNSIGEWAVSNYDMPSTLKGALHYQLPFGAGKQFSSHSNLVNQLIGNFSTSGVFTVASGFPNYTIMGASGNNVPAYFTSFTPKGTNPTPIGIASGITAPTCTTTNFCAGSGLPTGYYLRPSIVPGVPLINPQWKSNPFGMGGLAFTPYLNSAAFAPPGALGSPALGNAPRTLTGARSPREFMLDMRAMKGFSFHERYTVSLIAQASDVFNHPVYFASNLTATDAFESSQTNVTSGATPSITFTQNAAQFGHFNGNTSNLSRIVTVGAEFTF